MPESRALRAAIAFVVTVAVYLAVDAALTPVLGPDPLADDAASAVVVGAVIAALVWLRPRVPPAAR